MNFHVALLLALLALAAASGLNALHGTEPAWRRIISIDWLPDRWTNPPICTGVELTVGCVPLHDVPAD